MINSNTEERMKRKFLSDKELDDIAKTIAAMEEITSAEIVVCIKTKSCVDTAISNPCLEEKRMAVEKAAQQKLEEVCVGNTKNKNGVVLLISPEDRMLAVCGDEAVSEAIGDWPMVTLKVIAGIRDNNPVEGIIDAIQVMGFRLKKQFPIEPDDVNELPNRVIIE